MANLFEENYSRKELLEHIGQISQGAGVEAFEYSDGGARGVRGLEFRTGNGFPGIPGEMHRNRCAGYSEAG